MDKNDLIRKIDAEYNRIWNNWFGNEHEKAKLDIEFLSEDQISKLVDTDSCYSHKLNNIKIKLTDHHIISMEKNPCNSWPSWKTELVHELLHEYQFKVLKKATSKGIELMGKGIKTFGGNGHNDIFYSAIVEKACYFSLTPEEFLNNL